MRHDGEFKDFPIIFFEDKADFADWLKKHHQDSTGIWIRYYKKNSGIQTLNWADSVPVALQYGWIDSQAKGFDEASYLQKFTPRKKNSLWSKINRELAEEMIRNGTMSQAGLAAVEMARENGNWDRAYAGPASMKMPEDFRKALETNKKAKTFYETLNKTNSYAILWRIMTAKKAETREKRIKTIIEMLEKGEKFH